MSLTTSSWSRPIQGVSQQPPKVRLPGQCSVQDNATSSVTEGLSKRFGTIHQNKLYGAPPKGSRYYYYSRGTDEEYFIVIPPNGTPVVFDNKGDRLEVENELSDSSYIKTDNPETDLAITTISDYTFIANREVVPKTTGSKTRSRSSRAILNLQYADYGRKYKVFIEGELASGFMTPDGAEAPHINKVATSNVIDVLYNHNNSGDGDQFGMPLKDFPGYTFDVQENTIVVTKDDGGDFDIQTADGSDGKDFIAIQGRVTEVGDLPTRAPVGYTVEVVGQGNTDDDNYYLTATDKSGGTVTWKETVGFDQSKGFDKETMPIVLVRDRFSGGKAVFKLQNAPYEERACGDDDSNPFPSFIKDGEPINSIGTFQNRLYFTAGEAVIYSRSNYFFDFFRDTVRTPLDDEPIDIMADTNKVNYLMSSEILNGDLVLFSPNGQFLQLGDKPVTKENASLRYASNFENLADCEPASSGDTVFFAFQYGRYSGIREFYTDSLTDTKKARPITDHVDEFIEGNAKLLATSTNRSQMLVLAEDPSILYVYEWLWQGNERVQSSWSRWLFDGDVKYAAYNRDDIYLIIEREGNLYLEYIKTGDPADPALDFAARLDQRHTEKARYREGKWVILYDGLVPEESLVVVQSTGCISPGVTVSFEYDESAGELVAGETLSEGEGDVTVIMGRKYNMTYRPTMPFIKDQEGRVIESDRITLNDVSINYNKTGLTFVYVENDYGVKRDYSFNGRKVGGINNIVGFAPIRPGQFRFPVRQESDKVVFRIETESHVPFQLRDMGWRGRFHQRGRRV